MYGQHIQYQSREGGQYTMSVKDSIKEILSNYNQQQTKKIQDFLLSEIDEETLQETVDFVKSSDTEKREYYKDILYVGDKYNGLFIEGNQYLISSSPKEVIIIDMVSEENGVSEKQTRISFPILNFIYLVNNAKEVIEQIKE